MKTVSTTVSFVFALIMSLAAALVAGEASAQTTRDCCADLASCQQKLDQKCPGTAPSAPPPAPKPAPKPVPLQCVGPDIEKRGNSCVCLDGKSQIVRLFGNKQMCNPSVREMRESLKQLSELVDVTEAGLDAKSLPDGDTSAIKLHEMRAAVRALWVKLSKQNPDGRGTYIPDYNKMYDDVLVLIQDVEDLKRRMDKVEHGLGDIERKIKNLPIMSLGVKGGVSIMTLATDRTYLPFRADVTWLTCPGGGSHCFYAAAAFGWVSDKSLFGPAVMYGGSAGYGHRAGDFLLQAGFYGHKIESTSAGAGTGGKPTTNLGNNFGPELQASYAIGPVLVGARGRWFWFGNNNQAFPDAPPGQPTFEKKSAGGLPGLAGGELGIFLGTQFGLF